MKINFLRLNPLGKRRKATFYATKLERECMTAPLILSVAAAAVLFTSTGPAKNYEALAAKGYRWVTVDGPYGCLSKDDLLRITKHHTDEAELQMTEQLRAYYLTEGAIVKVVQEDAASGISQIHAAEIRPDVWTLTRFLNRRPMKDAYGQIETPESVGLVPATTTGTSGIAE